MSKGLQLKRTVYMYTGVLAIFISMVFLLMISFQINSYWGSRVLLIILALNLIVPLLAMASIDQKSVGKVYANPSATDKFLSNRGKNCSFKDARKRNEFWLFAVSMAITVGISIMMDENGSQIALYNVQTVDANRRTYNLFKILGAFSTGVFLSLFRIYISPYALMMFNTFCLFISQLLMLFVQLSPLALFFAVLISATV